MKNKNDKQTEVKHQENTSFEKFRTDTRRIYHDLYQSYPPEVRNTDSQVHQQRQPATRVW